MRRRRLRSVRSAALPASHQLLRIAAKLASGAASNPAKLRHYAIVAGLTDPAALDRIPTEVERIRDLRRERYQRQQRIGYMFGWAVRPNLALERWESIKAERARQAETDRCQREADQRVTEVRAAPLAAHWRSDRLAAVVAEAAQVASQYSRYQDTRAICEDVERAAAAATLELIAREARRRGWLVKRSLDRLGRASSLYLRLSRDRPGVRISDHELPDTAERRHNHETFGRSWTCEFVIGIEIDWRRDTLDAVMAGIAAALTGEEREEADD
jgi:hypothetical protein